MSNSPLVNYTKMSPFHTKMANKKITIITPHHAAGVTSVEGLGATAQTRGGAANYGIGSDGRIGLYVDESNSAHTSSNQANDRKAVTIEVSNSKTGGNWPVSDEVLERLIQLCVDICKRNNIPYLNFTGDIDGNMTMHAWFGNTGCPGPYLSSKFPYVANEVNRRLGSKFVSPEKPNKYNVGDMVQLKAGALYYNNYGVPDWLFGRTLYIRNVYGKFYDVSIYKDSEGITGRVHEKYLISLGGKEDVKAEEKEPEQKPVTNDLQEGDVITLVEGAKYTNGKNVAKFVFKMKLYVRKVNGDSITISIFKSGPITGIVPRKYIIKNGEPASKEEEKKPIESTTNKVPYLVQVKKSGVYIRKGAGMAYGTKGVINPGVYTIVEEKNGFGKLKSGIGWINLSESNKI